jgi:hypothetical protein
VPPARSRAIEAHPTTVIADTHGISNVCDDRIQFASLGFHREEKLHVDFVFPAVEAERTYLGGMKGQTAWALRSHPVRVGQYRLQVNMEHSDSFALALRDSWRRAFQQYDPQLVRADQRLVYQSSIQLLDHYFFQDSRTCDIPGFAFITRRQGGTHLVSDGVSGSKCMVATCCSAMAYGPGIAR